MSTKTANTQLTLGELNELAELSGRVLNSMGEYRKGADSVDVVRFKQLTNRTHELSDAEVKMKIKGLQQQGYKYLGWCIETDNSCPAKERKPDGKGRLPSIAKYHYLSRQIARRRNISNNPLTTAIKRTVLNQAFRLWPDGKLVLIGQCTAPMSPFAEEIFGRLNPKF